MSVDNFNLKCPILLGKMEREAIKPESEDVQKINLALRYLGLTENVCSGSSPGNGFYDDIEKFQRKYSCPIGEPPTNSCKTVNSMKNELRKEVEAMHRVGKYPAELTEFALKDHEALNNMTKLINFFQDSGRRYASRALSHFLYGQGREIHYSKEEIRNFKAIRAAEDYIFKEHFLGKTMTGQTGNSRWNNDLKNLKDGQTIPVKDYWDRDLNGKWHAFTSMWRSSDRDFYATFGDIKITGFFSGHVSKQGQIISYRVQPTFEINDKFDWGLDQIQNDWKIDFPAYKSAWHLEARGLGKPFSQTAKWETEIKTGSIKIP